MSSVAKQLAVAAAVLGAVAASGCGSSSTSTDTGSAGSSAAAAAQSGNVTVQIKNFAFAPPSLTVKVGSVVTWNNGDGATHTATAVDGTFDSGNIDAGGSSKPVTFSKAGTVQFRCNIHQYMTGTITVTS